MNKKLILTGALGIIAIILGAFGACLKSTTTRTTNYFETGVRYQMYHALF
jgi:uncharacterized membrane protein YgdD (TMEM256/DUF423 family)